MLRPGLLALTVLAVSAAGLAMPATADEQAPEPRSSDDPALVVADDGTTFAVDEWPAPPDGPVLTARTATVRGAAQASYDAADAFTLHSRRGASRTIYLDFDGGSLLSTNSWLDNGLSQLVFPGWSLDGSSAFSATERAVVIEVWERMAEDFAPFDIDVTTQEPASGGLFRSSSGDTTFGARVAFTSGSAVQNALCGGGCGGIAWIGTFDSITSGETRSPAWVFPSSLGNRAKNLAEAGSHEAGHTLGLNHDGTGSSGYYGGTSLWGPLMGAPYSAGVTQWSRGDYPGANNREDDLAKMQTNGVALRPDEAGASAGSATPLADLPGGRGVISSRSDADWLAVTACSGSVAVQAQPTAVGANLDVGLQVRDASGTVLASAAPDTSRTSSGVTGQAASLSVPLSGGPYYVVVSGTGSGRTWSGGGYDDYGSLGSYRVTVAGCSGSGTPSVDEPPVVVPPVVGSPPPLSRPGRPARPAAASGPRGGRRTVLAAWRAPRATGGTPVTRYLVSAYRVGTPARTLPRTYARQYGASVHRVSLSLPRGTWVVRVRARNKVGWGAYSSASVRVVSR